MKRKGLILAVLAAIVAAVMGLAACNGNGDTAPVQYTVTFETNGGSAVAPITVDEGGSVTLPTPEKTHFNFDGWFDNAAYNGSKLSSPYTPTADATLYAKWEAAQYTVSFETNDGNITINPVTVEGGKSVDLPTPEKTHFNFVGWFDNVDLNGDRLSSPYTPTANITLYAKWEAVRYTVTFETNGGSTVAPVTVDEGGSVNLPTPKKTDFTFVGWFANEDLNGDRQSSPYTPTANVTLYAKWEAIVYTDEAYFTFEKIEDSSNTIIGYSVSLASGTVPSNINVPASHNSKPVLTVKSLANENVNEIAIFDSVTEIESGAFSGCNNLEKITLPFVGRYADSSDSSATHFGYVFGASSYSDNSTAVPAKLKTVVVTGGNIGSSAFRGCSNLTSITIPDTVTSIGGSAFYGCSGLTSITIPDSVTSIGNGAFSGCSGLTSITIPDTVTSIGNSAFYNCSGLTSITIPDTVTSIGSSAFKGCDNLEKITLPFVGGGALGYITGATHFGYIFGAISYNDNSTGVPEKLKTVVVTGGSIARSAFEDCSGLTSITIPNTVTSIGNYAFMDCSSLTSITIPNTVTSIGIYAFYGCSKLTSITIPNTVTSIVDSAFRNCSDLTSVTIGSGVTSIDDYAFLNCSSLTSITIPDTVTSIGENAFSGCSGLTSITIPNSVTSIGDDAFMDSGLTSVTIGSGVTAIGGWAFYNCYKLIEVYNLSSLDITAGSTTHGYVARYAGNVYTPTSGASKITTADGYIFYNGNASYYLMGYNGTDTVLTLPNDCNGNNYAIYERAFYGCSGATSITIPDSVTSIGEYAFYNCSGLTSITIPNSVKTIGESAFYNCSGLTSITIPNTVTSIGDSTFYGCSGLTSITIPNTVTSIGKEAFSGCSGLTSVTIGSGVETIGDSAFKVCYKLIEVYNLSSLDITAGFTTHGGIARYAKNVYKPTSGASKITTRDGYIFYNDNGSYHLIGYSGTDTKLTLPNDYDGKDYTIYDRAFYGCSKLTSITIPNTVTSIGDRAFWGCYGLTSVTIGSGVETIGEYAFYNCSGLTRVTIGSGVIGNRAFDGCSSLTSVTIGSGVTSIGGYAFRDCSSLTSITIPDSVTSIGSNAFYECTSLTSVTIGSGVITIGSSAFYNCSGLTSITVAAGNTTYKSSGNCLIEIATEKLIVGSNTSVIPTDGSVTSIGWGAFYNCSGLTSITIPNTVKTIGGSAFMNCGKLTSITFNGTKAQWTDISKGSLWANKTPSFTVECTDGTLSKSEAGGND